MRHWSDGICFLLDDNVTSFHQDVAAGLTFSKRRGIFFGTSAKRTGHHPAAQFSGVLKLLLRVDCVSVEEK